MSMKAAELRHRVRAAKRVLAPERGEQAWFAERLGVTPMRVSRWWRGVHPVDPMVEPLLRQLEAQAKSLATRRGDNKSGGANGNGQEEG